MFFSIIINYIYAYIFEYNSNYFWIEPWLASNLQTRTVTPKKMVKRKEQGDTQRTTTG